MQAGHLVFLLQPLAASLGKKLQQAHLSRVVEQAVLYGGVQDLPPLFRRVRLIGDALHIVKKVRLLLQDQRTHSPAGRRHHPGVEVELRREAQHDLLQKRAVGHPAACLDKGAAQLPEVEGQVLLLLGGERIHVVQRPPVQAVHIGRPAGNPLRLLHQILTVEGRQGYDAVYALRRMVLRVRRIQQLLNFCQQPAKIIQAAVILDGTAGEGPPKGRPLVLGLRLLDSLLVDDVNRLHDAGGILRRHDLRLVVGDAAGHLLVGHVEIPLPGQVRLHLLIVLILHNPKGFPDQPDLSPLGLEGAQSHVGPGAQDIPPGFRILDLVKIFQIGRRLGEAQAHPAHVFLNQLQIQASQIVAQPVVPHTQPVQLPDSSGPVPLQPGQAQQRLVNPPEQPRVHAAREFGGEILQLPDLLLFRLEQVVQRRDQTAPQQLHVPLHLPPGQSFFLTPAQLIG